MECGSCLFEYDATFLLERFQLDVRKLYVDLCFSWSEERPRLTVCELLEPYSPWICSKSRLFKLRVISFYILRRPVWKSFVDFFPASRFVKRAIETAMLQNRLGNVTGYLHWYSVCDMISKSVVHELRTLCNLSAAYMAFLSFLTVYISFGSLGNL